MTAGSDIDVDLLRRVAWLDLADAQIRFQQDLNPDAYLIRTQTSLEYRRFLLMRLAYPGLDIAAPPLIDTFWRLHAADEAKFASDCASLAVGTELGPDELVPPPQPAGVAPSAEVRALHEAMFPYANHDLWGWPMRGSTARDGAPGLGNVVLRLPDAIDEPTREALRRQALEQRDGAGEVCSDTAVIERGAVHAGFHYLYSWAAPAPQNWHLGLLIARLIAERIGAVVAPIGAYFNYYRDGDCVSIHNDGHGYDLVLLTLLAGPIEPLHCHVHLADTPLEEIQRLAQATNGRPKGATPLEVSSVPLLLSGQRIPHHREPQERDEETIVLVQFFALVMPTRPVP